MLQLTGEKMSKSVGNIVSLRDAVERWGRETILLFFMTAHWRKPIDFSDDLLEQAHSRWRTIAQRLYERPAAQAAAPWEHFEDALNDDFNTPDALAILHEWADRGQLELLDRGLRIFGLAFVPETPPEQVQELAKERDRARAAKDFGTSDELRDKIAELGWVVQDAGESSTLVPK
jgi:cysteinyl-tRNA synthetase